MNTTLVQQKTLAGIVSPQDKLEDPCPADETLPATAWIQADSELAARCVTGEVAAWEEIYAQCHDPLCTTLRHILGGGFDATLVDEIAARVWYSLVTNDGQRLARYLPERGARLITYLRALACDELRRHYRSEIRRRRRETVFALSTAQSTDADEEISSLIIAEFLDTLTPTERCFCRELLLSKEPEEIEKCERSQANIWQLTHRTYKKMMHFLGR